MNFRPSNPDRELDDRPEIVVLLGPTAVGKTELAIELARRVDGEIVSADSRQVFRGMDIGTAKPTEAERSLARHHLIDVAGPDERFTAADFKNLAMKAIGDIHSRGKRAIVAGGTGLYLNALIGDFHFSGLDGDGEARAEVERRWSENPQAVHAELAALDPDAARSIHPARKFRLTRALELARTYGGPPPRDEGGLWPDPDRPGAPFRCRLFGLYRAPRNLNGRINKRVEAMYNAGLPLEAKRLMDAGFSDRLAPLKTIGYREAIGHLKGELSLEEAMERIRVETRRFAKRQRTWFRKMGGTLWLNLDRFAPERWAEWLAERTAAVGRQDPGGEIRGL